MCQTCISDSFLTGSGPKEGSSCPPPGQPIYEEGYCYRCALETKNMYYVSPFIEYNASNYYTADTTKQATCQACISNYNTQDDMSKPCNGHGTCRGFMSGQQPRYSESDMDYLSDKTQSWLGTCQCDDGYTGPTCALPSKPEACNGGLASNNLCQCEPGKCGFYCEFTDCFGQQVMPTKVTEENGSPPVTCANRGKLNISSVCHCDTFVSDPVLLEYSSASGCRELTNDSLTRYRAHVQSNYYT